MGLTLYYAAGSAPCRAVLLTAAALDIKLDLIKVDLSLKEQHSDRFLKINNQHRIPVFFDNGFKLRESRAICKYLVSKYGKGSRLYPQDDLKTRALIDEKLDFDIGLLYKLFAEFFYPQFFAGKKARLSSLKMLEEALHFLNTDLENSSYLVDPQLTLADLSIVATVSTIEGAAGIDLTPYKNIQRWYKLVKSTAPKYEEANGVGARHFANIASKVLSVQSHL